MIDLTCSQCGELFEVPSSLSDRGAKCPRCGELTRVSGDTPPELFAPPVEPPMPGTVLPDGVGRRLVKGIAKSVGRVVGAVVVWAVLCLFLLAVVAALGGSGVVWVITIAIAVVLASLAGMVEYASILRRDRKFHDDWDGGGGE